MTGQCPIGEAVAIRSFDDVDNSGNATKYSSATLRTRAMATPSL
jgi:hypothetical protein